MEKVEFCEHFRVDVWGRAWRVHKDSMFVCIVLLIPALVSGFRVKTMSSFGTVPATDAKVTAAPTVELPQKLIVGYANWNECKYC